MHNWQAISTHLLRSVDPEFEHLPVYLFDAREVDNDLCSRDGCRAYTCGTLAVELSPQLVAAGQWRGDGFAAVFDITNFASWQELLGIVLHEAAHHLDCPLGAPIGDPAAARAAVKQFRARWAAMPKANEPEPRPWDGHGSQFVRAACHLSHRAGEVYESIRPRHLSFAETYYSVSEGTFFATLESELDSMQPIRQIIASEPPEAFTRLHELLTSRYPQQGK